MLNDGNSMSEDIIKFYNELQKINKDKMVVDKDGKILCTRFYGLNICIGDIVEVYPRARSLTSFIGVVKEITPVSIILENENNSLAVRMSEIKMIRKPKISRLESESK